MRTRWLLCSVFAACLCAALPVREARAAAPPGVSVRCVPDTIAADENGSWALTLSVVNGSSRGLFGDSLLLVVRPTGPGARDAQPPFRLMLPPNLASLSAGDSVQSLYTIAASARTATLEFRFHAHDGGGAAVVVTCAAHAAGSLLEDRYPATLERVGAQQAEMIRVPPVAGSARGAGVLLLSGADTDAAELLVPAVRLSKLGLSVVIAGAPGRGRSGGPDDFAGPGSLAAASAAFDTLAAQPGMDRARLGVWGISSGGTLALRLASARPADVRAVVAQSASYDLWATYRAAAPAGRRAIEAAAGRDSAQWRERSPLVQGGPLKPIVLVLHGERDDVFPVAPARAFAASLKDSGGRVVTRFLPQGRHALASADAVRFLQAELTPSR